jgi:hypothetical protein
VGTSKTWGLKGSHSKPKGCGASGAYAPGPDDEEEDLMMNTRCSKHVEDNKNLFKTLILKKCEF